MKLTKNFSLTELTKSYEAIRRGIDNTILTSKEVSNLRTLCVEVLQPIRDALGTVTVNSGFRCLELNRAIKSKDSSQHRLGEAADIEVAGMSNYDLACWIRDNVEFDQLILEFYDANIPSAGWVHVSFTDEGNRNQCLTIDKKGTRLGLG